MIRSSASSTRTQIVSKDGLVVAGNELSAEAGAEALERGGNAIDAIVAAGFVAFVAEPSMCGVGGAGHLTVFLAEQAEFYAVDHNVRAPGATSPAMFPLESEDSNYMGFPATVDRRNEIGPLSAGVPGAVAGLCAAHERWGRLELAVVMERAIALAEDGLPVTWRVASDIARSLGTLAAMPELAAILAPGGVPLTATDTWQDGDRLHIPGLAETLWRIAREGAAGFYTGPVAESIARASAGGITVDDLRGYRPKLSRERPSTYANAHYATCFDTVAPELLNVLEAMDLGAHDAAGPEYYHLIAEAMGCAFTDTLRHYGDPDFERAPIAGLVSAAFGRLRAAGIDLGRTAPRPMEALDPWPFDTADSPRSVGLGSSGGAHGTSHAAAADRDGNLVSLCTSIETHFGSMVLAPESGVLLNNAMQDFDPRPGRANSIAPGKMPLYGVPVLVAARNGEGVFAGSGAGGYRITASVVQPFINVVTYNADAQAAADIPRVFCQGDATFADDAIALEVRSQLADRGHTVIAQHDSPGSPAFGRVGLIVRDPATGELRSGSNPSDVTAAAAL